MPRDLEAQLHIPECVARVPVSSWRFGGKAVIAKSCVCVRNRSQPLATVCASAVRLSHARLLLEWSRKCVKCTCDAPRKPAETKVLVLGDGPTYRGLAKRLWNRFNGLRVCCHYMRHDPHVVISIDTRSFQKKESRALGRILQAFRFTKITSKDYVIYVCVCLKYKYACVS